LNELLGDFRNAGPRKHLAWLWPHADSRGNSWADVMSKTVKAERTLKARFLPHEEIPVPLPTLSESLSLVELVALRLSPVYYGSGVPAGDGTAVVTVPGFLGIDLVLFELHAWLARIGYRPYFSGMGLAAECPDMLAQNLLSTIERAYLETGRKVHLIGHSLGGIFARSVAVRMPNRINSVTTLGSPFRGLVVHAFVLMLANLVRRRIRTRYPKPQGCATSRCWCDFARSLRHNWPRSVAQTAIYTRDDGIVDWRYCVTGDPRVDIEVGGTHVGLIVNSTTYFRIAERLAEPRVRGRRKYTAK
jgi:triacylglycerol lipase